MGVLEPTQKEFKIFAKRGEIKRVRNKGISYGRGLERKDAFFAGHDGRYYMIQEIFASGKSAQDVNFEAKKLVITHSYAEPFNSEILGIFLWTLDNFEEGIFKRKISDFKHKLCVLPVDMKEFKTFVTLPMSEVL